MRDVAHKVHQRHIRLDRFGGKSRHLQSEVRFVKCRSLINLAGEEAGAKRTEWDEIDSKVFKRWQDLGLRASVEASIHFAQP